MAERTEPSLQRPTLKAWAGLDPSTRQKLLYELEECVAKPPFFRDCLGDQFAQKAAFEMGRFHVMTELKRQLRQLGVFE